jgi:hypothetical protein
MPTLWPLRQRRVLRQHSRPRGWKHSIGCRLRSPSQHPTLDAQTSIRCQFGSSWGPSRAHLWQRSRPRHSQHSGIRSHRCRYRRLAAAKPRRQQHASLHPAPACRPLACTQPGLGQHNRPGRAHGSPVFCLRQHSESTTTGSTAGPNANSKQLSSGGWLIVAFRGTQQPSCGRLRLRTSAFGAHSTAAMIRPACCRLGSTWRPAVACGNTAALIRRRHAVTCAAPNGRFAAPTAAEATSTRQHRSPRPMRGPVVCLSNTRRRTCGGLRPHNWCSTAASCADSSPAAAHSVRTAAASSRPACFGSGRAAGFIDTRLPPSTPHNVNPAAISDRPALARVTRQPSSVPACRLRRHTPSRLGPSSADHSASARVAQQPSSSAGLSP